MKIVVITACHNANGEPDFAWTEVHVTKKQYAEGEHYDKAERKLLDNDYEKPMVHFDAVEAKHLPWLVEGVKKYLRIPS